MAFGGLGVSLAGFAGLISALDRRPGAHSAVAVYRIRTIVFLGFMLTFTGFGTVALYTVTGEDLALTVRIASVLVAVPLVRALLVNTRPGPLWPDERERLGTIAFLLVNLAVTLGNLVTASVGYLQLLMLLSLLGPVSVFYNTIRDATRDDAGDEAADT